MANVAVLVGVPNPQPSRFSGKKVVWPELHGVDNDLRSVRAMLLDAAQPLPEPSIVSLVDPPETTAKAINEALDHYAGQLEPGDLFILMLDGHGYHVSDADGDESDGWDEVFIASDGKPVMDDEFAERWNRVNRDVTIIGLVDTCFADTSGLYFEHPARLLPKPALPIAFRLSEGPSRLFFSASLQDEEAFETEVCGHPRGVLSAALTDVWSMTEGARQSYETLFGYARELAKQYDGRQTARVRFAGRELAPILKRRPFAVGAG